jgi:hypothetical protein
MWQSHPSCSGSTDKACAFKKIRAFAKSFRADANPLKIKAFIAALDEASEMIVKDPKGSAATYLAATKEKISVDELAALITQPGAIFSATRNAACSTPTTCIASA